MSLIKVENLIKEFKQQKREKGFRGLMNSLFNREYIIKTAVDNISFNVDKGEIVGYIGPNGAGKSTTIKLLVGILVPTSGRVIVNGLEPYKKRKENAKNIGVVFGQRTQLWWDIPVSESLNLMKYMYRIPERKFKINLDLFSEILEIHKFINLPVRQLSLGQRMRADLCAALLHSPDIIYLDEPTIGLDVVVKKAIREFIKEINKTLGTTVILTTHDMADIEKLCSRVIVIDHGNIIYDDNLDYLRNKFGNEEILSVEFDEIIDNNDLLSQEGINEVNYNENKLIIKYDKKLINSSKVLGHLMSEHTVKDFVVQETEIDEIIRRMYQGNLLKEDRISVS